jgi:hypothetical protein
MNNVASLPESRRLKACAHQKKRPLSARAVGLIGSQPEAIPMHGLNGNKRRAQNTQENFVNKVSPWVEASPISEVPR